MQMMQFTQSQGQQSISISQRIKDTRRQLFAFKMFQFEPASRIVCKGNQLQKNINLHISISENIASSQIFFLSMF